MEGGRLAEDQAVRGGGLLRVEAESGEAFEQALQGDAGFQAGQVGGEAVVRAVGEGQLKAGFGAADVEPVRVGEDGRIAVGAGQRDADEVAAADGGRAEHGVAGGVAVHHSRAWLQPQGLLDGSVQAPPAP